MSRIPSRIIVITLILFAFAAIAVGVRWSSMVQAAPASAPPTLAVSLPNVTAAQGTIATIPITVGNVTGLGLLAYDMQITYDPTVLQPATPPYDRAGTLSTGMAVIPTTNFPGHLTIGAFHQTVLSGSGTLLNLRFNVIGATGTMTTLRFEDYTDPNNHFHFGCLLNEGNPQAVTTNGSLTVGGATPTGSPTPTATNQATPTASPLLPVRAALPDVIAAPGSIISIPVTISDVTGFGVFVYELQVSFDPNVIQPASPAFDLEGTLGPRMFPFPNASYPGHLIVPAFQQMPPIAGAGVLVYLRFTVVGTTGQSTPLVLEDWLVPGHPPDETHPGLRFNEGDPSSVTTNGSVTVGDVAIAGTVAYANSNGAPRFVSNAILSGAGSVPGLARTNNDGTYLYSGFGSGSYTITPSKTGAVNGAVSSYDAAKVAQHVAGINILGTLQKYVANVSSDTTVSSFDAAMIAKFAAGPPFTGAGIGSTATWRFQPSSRTYPFTAGIITNENYDAVLMGEVSGNWTSTGARPVGSRTDRSIGIAAPRLAVSSNKEIVMPISIRGAAKKGIISYEFDLRYDPSVMQPETDPVDLAGTVSRGLSVVTNTIEPGLLRVVVYGPMPISDDGVLLNLNFTAVGKAGSVSSLTWERIMFNEGEPRVNATDGMIQVF